MPPPLPHVPLSCLIRPKPAKQSSLSSLRALTTSAPLSFIGPENPKFIDIPLPPQRYAQGKRDIKGKLPSPRDIFHRRGPTKNGRTLKQHLRLATLPPSTKRLDSEPLNERIAWKQRMAESRRRNLRDGIRALHERKHNQENAIKIRSHKKQKDRDARLNAPQREDERLTNPTITEAMRELQIGPVADPQRETRIAEKKLRVAAKEVLREEARKNSLHTLYMHARNFIVTEEQLNLEVDRIFVEHPWGVGHTNIWEAFQEPDSVEAMMRKVDNTQKGLYDTQRGKKPGMITATRMNAISEELTGGKMDK